MAQEPAPRFHLVATTRTIWIFFSISALLSGHTYIGALYDAPLVCAAFAVSWAAVAWNIICVSAVTLHPYLQRLAGGLPFPVKVTIRNHTIVSYGDSDEVGDGILAPLTGTLFVLLVDVVLATLILVFALFARDARVECRREEWRCVGGGDGGYERVEKMTLNVWWIMVLFEYALALIQAFQAFALWYKSRYLDQRGNISLA
ncbi:Uu.00g127610.m01.CDS01 [Anthostomella pinea]|uniref:Uu.00g127610.m01.CDS01 n=1 Tax=Anthostomella pinea TaxID=933095 RepID=A0AAI8VI74_9PEZI|nr:Uu.00g127610.m01.CDS01 [Anthostomella pinea]